MIVLASSLLISVVTALNLTTTDAAYIHYGLDSGVLTITDQSGSTIAEGDDLSDIYAQLFP